MILKSRLLTFSEGIVRNYQLPKKDGPYFFILTKFFSLEYDLEMSGQRSNGGGERIVVPVVFHRKGPGIITGWLI